MNPETILQNQIRAALSEAVLFRVNVGVFKTADGRTISTGVPVGFPDLFGFRRSDGRAVFIEVKMPGKKPTEKQAAFLDAVRAAGALAGIARSVQDAIEIVEG